MLSREPTAESVAFGCFEVNLATGEVFRNGRRLRLSGQPSQVLVILLQRPGQLVTRDELRLQLWPDETFVDFDHGLNNCINRIRELLGDSATNPRFIETLPKQGYRFIAPVGVMPEAEAEPSPAPSPPEELQAVPVGQTLDRIPLLYRRGGGFRPCRGCWWLAA